MTKMHEKVDGVVDQASMARFIKGLADDYCEHREDWANDDLESFLRAMSAWVEDMDGYYKNVGQPYTEKDISWKNIADMLIASKVYE